MLLTICHKYWISVSYYLIKFSWFTVSIFTPEGVSLSHWYVCLSVYNNFDVDCHMDTFNFGIKYLYIEGFQPILWFSTFIDFSGRDRLSMTFLEKTSTWTVYRTLFSLHHSYLAYIFHAFRPSKPYQNVHAALIFLGVASL